MQRINFIAKRFQEFNFGQVVWSKGTFLLAIVNVILLVSIKWDVSIEKYLVIIIPVTILLIWLTGYVAEKTGFRKAFMIEQYKHIMKGVNDVT